MTREPKEPDERECPVCGRRVDREVAPGGRSYRFAEHTRFLSAEDDDLVEEVSVPCPGSGKPAAAPL